MERHFLLCIIGRCHSSYNSCSVVVVASIYSIEYREASLNEVGARVRHSSDWIPNTDMYSASLCIPTGLTM